MPEITSSTTMSEDNLVDEEHVSIENSEVNEVVNKGENGLNEKEVKEENGVSEEGVSEENNMVDEENVTKEDEVVFEAQPPPCLVDAQGEVVFEAQPLPCLVDAQGVKDINVFYEEFIAFVAWSKKIHGINSVNLATINSNVKLVNSKCDKILSNGRLKRYNSAIIPLLQSIGEVGAGKTQNDNSAINIEHVSITPRQPKPRSKLNSVTQKRKEHPKEEVEETRNHDRRISKRIRSIDPIELVSDLVEDKENSSDSPREEAEIVENNLACLRSESKDLYTMKCENNNDFDDIVSECLRLGLEAKRIYKKAGKLHTLVPFIGPEIKVMITQMVENCSAIIDKDQYVSKKQKDRFNEVKVLLDLDQEIDEEGGINEEETEVIDNESLESDVNILQHFCDLFLQRSYDKDFYTEAKRLCTRSVILSKLAKRINYNVSWIENLMNELFHKISEHYLSAASSREVKFNLIMQNKRYKTNAKELNFYDRFLGSKKLKMPEKKTSPKKPPISPIKLQLLPQVSIKKVHSEKNASEKKVSESAPPNNTAIEKLLHRYNKLYNNCENFLNILKNKTEKLEMIKKTIIAKQQVCAQLIADAMSFERQNWIHEDKVQVARMVMEGAKRISLIISDNEKWFRNYPFKYYNSDDSDSDLSEQPKEVIERFLKFQKDRLKTLVQRFLKKEPDEGFYEQSVRLGTEIVRLNRRSLDHLTDANDMYKLTLRLYKKVSDYYESKASQQQVAANVQLQNKKGDTKRKILHYYDPDAKIEQISLKAFLNGSGVTEAPLSNISNLTQDSVELSKQASNSIKGTTKGVHDIRSYFTKTSSTQNHNSDKIADSKTELSGVKGGWRETGDGSESENEVESNHSEYKASEASDAESSEDEVDEEMSEDQSSDNESSDGDDSTTSENESEKSNSGSDSEDENDENLEDKKCTVHISGLARHHTPLYMRSFLETRKIPVIKCHVLPGPKSANSTIAVTVNGVHKRAINKFWGKTFKLTFHIH